MTNSSHIREMPNIKAPPEADFGGSEPTWLFVGIVIATICIFSVLTVLTAEVQYRKGYHDGQDDEVIATQSPAREPSDVTARFFHEGGYWAATKRGTLVWIGVPEGTPEPCPICGGDKVLVNESTGKEEPCEECGGTGLRKDYGRIGDGALIDRIAKRRDTRIETRNKVVRDFSGLFGGFGNLLGLPAHLAWIVGLVCVSVVGLMVLGFVGIVAAICFRRRQPIVIQQPGGKG